MVSYTDVKKEDLCRLKEFGFWTEEIKSKYELARLRNKDNSVIILFTTNKLLVQGKEDAVKGVEKIIDDMKIGNKVKPIEFVKEHGVCIGSDEALKGDTFGGIVVAAVKADDSLRQDLMFAGAVDSKKLDDDEIPVIAERIKKIAKYKVISMMPEEYNNYNSVTQLLNKSHTEAIEALRPSDAVFVDKYPGCAVKGAHMETKGESKYVEVAAASILAREASLEQLRRISKMVGFDVPKGSTHVKEALERISKEKVDFRKVVKLNFNNVKKYL